jgi:hypothetical protein
MYVERAQESPGAKSRGGAVSDAGLSALDAAPRSVGGRAARRRRWAVVFPHGRQASTSTTSTARRRSAAPSRRTATRRRWSTTASVGGQMLIASGSNAYNFVLATNTFSQVLTGKATMIAYCKGYFLAFELATGKVYLSALNDGTTWTLTTFFQRSKFADRWQAMFVDGNNLSGCRAPIASRSGRYNPTSTQPFAPLSGLVGRFGIASPFAFGVGRRAVLAARNPEGAGVSSASAAAAPSRSAPTRRECLIDVRADEPASRRGSPAVSGRRAHDLNLAFRKRMRPGRSTSRAGWARAAAGTRRGRITTSGRRARTCTRSASTWSPIGRRGRSGRWTRASTTDVDGTGIPPAAACARVFGRRQAASDRSTAAEVRRRRRPASAGRDAGQQSGRALPRLSRWRADVRQ